MNNSVYLARLTEEMRSRRDAVQAEATARRDELHAKFPDIEQIDRELALTGMNFYRAALSGNAQDAVEKQRRETIELRRKRAELLKKHGYPEDYTSPHYECARCEDTGYIGIDMCGCLKRAVKREAFLASGLGRNAARQSFANFDVSLCSPESREHMNAVYSACVKYADEFSMSSPNLLFYGGTGLGKTHLSAAIAMAVLDKGFSVIYDSAQTVVRTYERQRFARDASELAADKYTDAELLILDDLGTEYSGGMTLGSLYYLINSRTNMRRPTVISTNLTESELRTKYDDRIISRLFGEFTVLHFTGSDVRRLKLESK